MIRLQNYEECMEETTTYKTEMTASEATLSLMQNFARYSIGETIPHKIDGLKLVHRRVLHVLGTNDEKQKMNNLVGATMQKYHPHGDSGIVDAIVRMCQTFNQVQPLVFTAGNFGDYGGGEAAAGRYLDVSASKFAKDLFFTRVNPATFSQIPTETDKGMEPAYFVPILPTALLTGAQGLAVGFSSIIPHMNLMSVCDAVERYLQLRKSHPNNHNVWYKELAQYFIPDFPTYSLLLNSKQLLEEYQKGNYDVSIIMNGTIDIYPDNLSLRTVPYQTTLSRIYDRLGHMSMADTPIAKYISDVADLSRGADKGHIDMALKRSANPFKALAEVKKVGNFQTSIKPIWNFTDEYGVLFNFNPVQLIDQWYIERHRSILGDLKITSAKLVRECRRLEARIIVADHVKVVVKIFTDAVNREATIPILMNKFNLSHLQATYLSTMQMHQITKKGREDLVLELKANRVSLKELHNKFPNIDDIILSDIEYMRKEYGKISARRTKLPDFIGAVQIDNTGYIQFSSIEELCLFARRWGAKLTEIIMYPSGVVRKVYSNGANIVDEEKLDLPKEFSAEQFEVLKNKPQATVVIRNRNIFRLDRITGTSQSKINTFTVAGSFIAVHTDGRVTSVNTNSLPLRRDIVSAGISTDIYDIYPITTEDLIVVYCNEKTPNIIIFERMKVGNKIQKDFIGKTRIIHVCRPSDPYAVVLKPPYLARCAQKMLYIKNLDVLFKDASTTRAEVFMYRKTTSVGKRLVPIAKHSDIWTIK